MLGWRRWRYSPISEKQQCKLGVEACNLWCGTHGCLMVAGFALLRSVHLESVSAAAFTVPVLLCSSMFGVANLFPMSHLRMVQVTCAVCVCMMVWTGWILHRVTQQLIDDTLGTSLRDVREKLAGDPGAMAYLQAYVKRELDTAAVAAFFMYNFVHFDLLRLSGCPRRVAFAVMSVPVAFIHGVFLLPMLANHFYAAVLAAAMLAAYSVMLSLRV
eukprot:EG_transcript_25066